MFERRIRKKYWKTEERKKAIKNGNCHKHAATQTTSAQETAACMNSQPSLWGKTELKWRKIGDETDTTLHHHQHPPSPLWPKPGPQIKHWTFRVFDFNPWLTLKAFTYAWVRFCSMQSFPCIHRNIAKYNDRSNFHVPLNVYVLFFFFKLIKYRAPNDTQFARLWRTRTDVHPFKSVLWMELTL